MPVTAVGADKLRDILQKIKITDKSNDLDRFSGEMDVSDIAIAEFVRSYR